VLRKHPVIKKNDKVIVLAGKEKGKIGNVLTIIRGSDSIIVEKINLVKRHTKPSAKSAQGGIIEKEAPIHVSNLKIICNKCAEPTRVGKRILDDGSKVRICKKCDEILGE
jgi:large subunit ribosomal protein L24